MTDLADLETFVAVADAGGVSGAARRLGLPKSIVSRRLARLESELNTQLLTRTTRGAALTEAGATFREHAARVVAELEAARDSLSPEGELRGLLRIAAPLSFGASHLAPLVAEFASQHPQLQITTSYGDRFVDLVAEGFDVAIRLGWLPDSTLVARRIGPVTGRLVATPDYIAKHGAPATLDDIARHPALMQGTEIWRVRDGDQIVALHPQGRFKADNGQALVAAVLAGLGIAMLPDFLIDEHIASGALITLLPQYPMPEAGLYVVRPPGDHPSRKVRVFTDMLVERLSARCNVAPGKLQLPGRHPSN
ncbi:MAG TPA: LysR family transcriptional regulator [Steroidobacteraceae bacterium]|nr:LysR family transcriptional regulator [Steroidobacteraceae bacterium]